MHQGVTIQRDLDRLENWAERKLLKFNKEKHQFLYLGRNKPRDQHMLGTTIRKSTL